MVATKSPYPPVDGGRLLMWHTIREMSNRGHNITLVAPSPDGVPINQTDLEHLERMCHVRLVETKPRGLWKALLISRLARKPASVIRHSASDVRAVVAEEIDSQRYDVLHVEQVQALQNVPQGSRCPPTVLRCQNVESRLWEMFGNLERGLRSAARWEARMMRRYEAAALHRASLSIALTEQDREDLCELSGLPDGAIRTITAPFPAQLPTGNENLAGEPAIVLMDGPWWPIRDSTDWFINEIWPEVRRELPHAVVHCYGDRHMSGTPDGLTRHPAPSDSSVVFARNAILVVPLRIASGLRMKILESWARGVPVVATPEAARGLETQDGHNLLLASTPNNFASMIRRLAEDEDLCATLLDGGRRSLANTHDPFLVGDSLNDAYRAAIDET